MKEDGEGWFEIVIHGPSDEEIIAAYAGSIQEARCTLAMYEDHYKDAEAYIRQVRDETKRP